MLRRVHWTLAHAVIDHAGGGVTLGIGDFGAYPCPGFFRELKEKLDGDLPAAVPAALAITNTSKYTAQDVEVVLMDKAHGRHAVSTIPSLGPGELTLLPLDEFVPPLPEGWYPSQAEVTAKRPTGQSVVTRIAVLK